MAFGKKQTTEERLKEYDKDLIDIGQSLNDDDINRKIAEYAKNIDSLEVAEKEDQDVADQREKLGQAREVYTSGKKVNKLRIKYLREILVARGKE